MNNNNTNGLNNNGINSNPNPNGIPTNNGFAPNLQENRMPNADTMHSNNNYTNQAPFQNNSYGVQSNQPSMINKMPNTPEILESLEVEQPIANTGKTVENTVPIIETIPTESTEFTTTTANSQENRPEITTQEPTVPNPPMPPLEDDFNAVPVPPVDTGKEKHNGQKIVILLLLIILIGLIGFSVYYFLNMAKTNPNNISIVTKDVKLELGQSVSNDIEEYATITGYNKEDCTLDINNINPMIVSTYKFSITCGNKQAEGTAIVDDTTKPQVTTTEVNVLPGATIKPDDFIEKCVDVSNCTYKFITDPTAFLAKIGEYEIEIEATDSYNNSTIVKGKLIVSATAPVRFMTCKKDPVKVENNTISLTETYKIGIDDKNNFYNAERTSEFQFNDQASYESRVSNFNESEGIENRTGQVSFNKEQNNITIKKKQTLEEMSTEMGAKFPKEATELKNWLWGVAGYICD